MSQDLRLTRHQQLWHRTVDPRFHQGLERRDLFRTRKRVPGRLVRRARRCKSRSDDDPFLTLDGATLQVDENQLEVREDTEKSFAYFTGALAILVEIPHSARAIKVKAQAARFAAASSFPIGLDFRLGLVRRYQQQVGVGRRRGHIARKGQKLPRIDGIRILPRTPECVELGIVHTQQGDRGGRTGFLNARLGELQRVDVEVAVRKREDLVSVAVHVGTHLVLRRDNGEAVADARQDEVALREGPACPRCKGEAENHQWQRPRKQARSALKFHRWLPTRHARYSIALTNSSTTFFASPNTIIVLSM